MKKFFYLFVFLFFVDFIMVITGFSSSFDNAISLFFSVHNNVTFTNIFKIISFICSPKFMIVLNVLLFIFIILKKKYKLFIIVLSSISSVIINNLVKIIVRRERPDYLRMVMEKSYSFPSGHAMISVLFFGSIIYLVNKYNLKYKKLITFSLSTFVLLVGISRIYLGVHYLTDVVGGYLLGFIVLFLIIHLFERKKFVWKHL